MTREELKIRYANGERNFKGLDLRNLDLRSLDLRGINLSGANLSWTHLAGADLSGADLSRSWLLRANLTGADLTGARLDNTRLVWADLTGADLTDTILDPMRAPNGKTAEFETIRDSNNTEWCVGYRTKDSPRLGTPEYEVGELRTAPWFSTGDDKCHPGIYVVPNVDALGAGDSLGPYVKVMFRPEECHEACGQWRVRWLIVVSEM